MNFYSRALKAFEDHLLARDDAGTERRFGEVLEARSHWSKLFGGEKRLVFLLCRNTTVTLETYLALAALGHTVALIDAGISNTLLDGLIATYKPDFIVDCRECPPKIMDGPLPGQVVLHENLSVLLPTSGSTGAPKFARFSAEQFEANALAISEYLQLSYEDRPLLHLPLHYSFGLSIVHSHLVVGGSLELTDQSLMSRDFWDRVRNSQVSSLSGVPFHFEILKRLRIERMDLPRLHTLAQAGGRLSPKVVRHFADLAASSGRRFYVMYGQTEAGPRITYVPPEDIRNKPASIGIAIPGVSVDLIDESGTPITEAGREGEIVCRSKSVMMGYALDASDLARGDEMHGRLATGDMAVRDDDGFLEITGRKSRFVKLQGNRVNLDQVESVLRSKGHEVVCVGEEDMLWAVMEGQGNAKAARQEAIDTFGFPPRSFSVVSVAEIPRTPSGKVRFAALLEQLKGDSL